MEQYDNWKNKITLIISENNSDQATSKAVKTNAIHMPESVTSDDGKPVTLLLFLSHLLFFHLVHSVRGTAASMLSHSAV